MDNLDRLLDKLYKRERIFGYSAYIPDVYTIAEYMPKGVDYILFDCEHGPHDIEYYSDYFTLCRMLDIPTVVRIPDAVYHLAARAIDCGADGVLVPRVETPEQVEAVIEGLRMPPLGRKGYGGKFLMRKGESIEEFNKRRMLWIQIESRQGSDRLPEILERYGDQISACVIGPCDLSISTSQPSEFRADAVRALDEKNAADVLAKTADLCKQQGISYGSYCFDVADALHCLSQGMNLTWVSCDANFMLQGIQEVAKKIADL